MSNKICKFKNIGKSLSETNQEESLKREIESENYVPIGIEFPLVDGNYANEGLFKMNYDVLQQISNNLKLFLQTKKGELLGKPDFGTLLSSLYNRTDIEIEDVENIAMQEVSTCVNKYFPFINLIDFTSSKIASDDVTSTVTYDVRIRYSIENYKENISEIKLLIRRSI